MNKNKYNWDYEPKKRFTLIYAMRLSNLPPFYMEKIVTRHFFTSDLTITQITKNIEKFIDESFEGDEAILNEEFYADIIEMEFIKIEDYEIKFSKIDKRLLSKIEKIERINEWLEDDIFAMKKAATSTSEERKIIEVENWLKNKIDDLNFVYSIPIYAQIYVYLIKYGKHKNIEDYYPILNKKEAFSAFAINELKLVNKGKTSFYIQYSTFYQDNNRLSIKNINYLKKVVKALKNDYKGYPIAYDRASKELSELLA